MSFRTASLIALLIGIIAAAAFSFAVIAYVKAQEAREAQRIDKVRTDAEIARIAEAVFRKHETPKQRSKRIRGAAKIALRECAGDKECVELGRSLFGITRERLRETVRIDVEAYCAQHDQCKGPEGRRGAEGATGPPGAQGSTGPMGNPGKDGEGRPGPTGPSGRDGTIDSSLLNALDNRVRNLETSLGTLLRRLCLVLRLCQ